MIQPFETILLNHYVTIGSADKSQQEIEGMPRILMTYAEVAEHFGGDAAAARQSAIVLGITRYKGPDGLTYVELSPIMAQQYLQSKLAHTTTDQQVSTLRHAASLMKERSGFAANQVA